jgi:hypothetical protein
MYGIYYTKKHAIVLLCNVFTRNALLLSYYVLFLGRCLAIVLTKNSLLLSYYVFF